MKITIVRIDQPLTPHLQRYIETMTRHVLHVIIPTVDAVVVRLDQTPNDGGRAQFACDLRVESSARAPLTVEGRGMHPHIAVERALEHLWTLVHRRPPRDGRSAA